MAVRFDAAADRIVRTSDLPNYNAAYTLMCWAQVVSSTTFGTIIAISDGSTNNIDEVFSRSASTLLRLAVQANINTITTYTVGTWFHVAMVRSSATSCVGYVHLLDGTSASTTSTQDVTSRTAATRLESGAIGTGNAEPFNGKVAYLKLWTAALTLAEIQREMRTVRPIRTANLYGWWPAFPGSGQRTIDYSGNGRDWTEGGTLTDEDGPPVSWGAPVLFVVGQATGGGTTYPSTVAGTLTTAGALVRRPATSKAGTLTSAGALTRRAAAAKAGSLTSSGALARQAGKVLAGTLSGAGILTRRAGKTLTGILTTAGALAAVKTAVISLAGTLTSAGSLARSARKVVAGALNLAGALARQARKVLAGSLTSSGSLTSLKAFFRSIGGTLTTAGALIRQTGKVAAGALGPTGALNRLTALSAAGTLTSAGALTAVRAFFKVVAGTLTSVGTLTRQAGKSTAGVLTSSGALSRAVRKVLAGVLSTAGALVAAWGGLLVKGTVTISDAAVTTLTLSDTAVTTLMISDAAVTTVTLSDAVI